MKLNLIRHPAVIDFFGYWNQYAISEKNYVIQKINSTFFRVSLNYSAL